MELSRPRGKIILITGIMAAGKSTIAQMLAENIEKSVHLRGDLFRKCIINGRQDMSAKPTSEAITQLKLRYKIAVSIASHYADEGYTVVYQDVIIGEFLQETLQLFPPSDLYLVVLCPDVSVIAEREKARTKKGYDGLSPKDLDVILRTQTIKAGYWMDSSKMTANETTMSILSNLASAKVSINDGRIA